jgi:hypothetical protein
MADLVSRALWRLLGLANALAGHATLPQGDSAQGLAAALGLGPGALPALTQALERAAVAERRACVSHTEATAHGALRRGAVELALELRALAYELRVGVHKGGRRG